MTATAIQSTPQSTAPTATIQTHAGQAAQGSLHGVFGDLLQQTVQNKTAAAALAQFTQNLTPTQAQTLQTQLQTIVNGFTPVLRKQLEQLAAASNGSTVNAAQLAALLHQNPAAQQALADAVKAVQQTASGSKTSGNSNSAAAKAAGAGLLLYAVRQAGQPAAVQSDDPTDAAATPPAATDPAAQGQTWDSNDLKQALTQALANTSQFQSTFSPPAPYSPAQANLLAEFAPAQLLNPGSKTNMLSNLKPDLKTDLNTLEAPSSAATTDLSQLAPKTIAPILSAAGIASGATDKAQDAVAALAARLASKSSDADSRDNDSDTSNNALKVAPQPVDSAITQSASQANPSAATTALASNAPAQHVIDQVNAIAQQLLGRVDGNVTSNGGNVSTTLQLHPAELGQVRVDLTLGQDHTVQAQITAQRPETAALLQRNTQDLGDSLARQGFTVTRLQVITQALPATAAAQQSDAGAQQQDGRAPWQFFRDPQNQSGSGPQQPPFELPEDQA